MFYILKIHKFILKLLWVQIYLMFMSLIFLIQYVFIFFLHVIYISKQ
jgi:hypothetical protein